MNRRDTIIIAILLNAGLLIVLFTTSLKSNKTEESAAPVSVVATHHSETSQAITPSAPVAALPAASDEVDLVLKQYVTPAVTNPPAETPNNFLADLQALGTPPPVDKVEESAPAALVKEVKVKKGDVLERIARQNRVSVQEIMKFNNLTSTRLKIGQVLKIPGKAVAASTSAVAEGSSEYYTVKNGDSLWVIAVRHNMKVEELLQLNGMDETKARRLKPGDRIRIK
jgi:peptidoglycan DL-endopeptidase LytF